MAGIGRVGSCPFYGRPTMRQPSGRSLSEPPAANRAKSVIRRKRPVAVTAGPGSSRWLRPGQIRSGIIGGPFAAVAEKGRLAGLDLEHRDEKNAKIVIYPLEIGLVQAAPWAAPGGFFQDFNLGLDAAYEKKETFDHDGAPDLSAGKAAYIRSGLPIFINSAVHTTFGPSQQAGANAASVETGIGRCLSAVLSLTGNMNSSIKILPLTDCFAVSKSFYRPDHTAIPRGGITSYLWQRDWSI